MTGRQQFVFSLSTTILWFATITARRGPPTDGSSNAANADASDAELRHRTHAAIIGLKREIIEL